MLGLISSVLCQGIGWENVSEMTSLCQVEGKTLKSKSLCYMGVCGVDVFYTAAGYYCYATCKILATHQPTYLYDILLPYWPDCGPVRAPRP